MGPYKGSKCSVDLLGLTSGCELVATSFKTQRNEAITSAVLPHNTKKLTLCGKMPLALGQVQQHVNKRWRPVVLDTEEEEEEQEDWCTVIGRPLRRRLVT